MYKSWELHRKLDYNSTVRKLHRFWWSPTAKIQEKRSILSSIYPCFFLSSLFLDLVSSRVVYWFIRKTFCDYFKFYDYHRSLCLTTFILFPFSFIVWSLPCRQKRREKVLNCFFPLFFRKMLSSYIFIAFWPLHSVRLFCLKLDILLCLWHHLF